MSKKYKIGQVLYITSPKTQAVVPVQIQEINQKTTIEGEETIYMIMDPDGKGPYNLEDVNGQVFIDTLDLSKTLKANAGNAIDALISRALNIAKERFSLSDNSSLFPVNPQPVQTQSQSNENIDEKDVNEVEVIGKDGKTHIQKQKVRIHMPNISSAH